jgi:serine protein kinase
MHVDAEYQLLTMNKSLSSLPASLMGINLFQVRGDLVDGNRGIIEYSDLLKRPIDAFKYLLGACESSSVNVGATIVHLDSIMIASSNELQLDAFKEFPDFSSFKARIKLIRVPYLMSYTKEQEIYESLLPQLLEDKPISPHVSWTLALWAVLSRLKKPNSVNFPPSIHSIISAMTPLEKAKLYDNGSISETISPEERKILKASISKLKNEYSNIPYYEGRMGASVREIKTILFDAINNPDHESLTPLAVFQALEEFTKRISEYEFLKQDIKEGYHDCVEYIQVVQNEYLNIIDREIRSCMGLYDSQQWEDFIKKYVIQVAALLKGEKLPNPITGKLSDPDRSLIEEFEKIVGAPTGLTEIEGFRKNVISQVGAWSLDHRSEKVVYSKVFPEYWTKLEKFYYESQKSILNKMYKALLVYGTDSSEKTSEGAILAQKTIENMIKLKGYTEGSARDVITFLMKRRYG